MSLFAEPQMVSLPRLFDTLKENTPFQRATIGYSDIAPKRKVDPNVTFPWQRLAQRGFGNWYDDTTNAVIPRFFDHLLALRLVGTTWPIPQQLYVPLSVNSCRIR